MFQSILATIEASGPPQPSALARTMVVVGIAACLVGAWRIARRLQRSEARVPVPGDYDAPIIDDDLLAYDAPAVPEPTAVRVFEIALIGVLLGYIFFDRGFAWFHIPGTPLFVGEITLFLGAVAVFSHPTPILQAIRRSPSLKVLIAFMTWGLVLLAVLGIPFGIDAIRDSVLWLYGAVAVFTVFLVVSDPGRIRRWTTGFARIVPWLVGWLFVAVILDSVAGSGPIFVPDSRVSLFSHGAGNAAVVAAICLAFIWLVDRDGRFFTPTTRMALTAALGALVLFASLKNRGGFVAATIGVILVLVWMQRGRFDLTMVLVGTGAVLASLALVSQFSVALFGAREVSVEQFTENITSIISPSSGGHRQTSTTEWRLELWRNVLGDVNSEFPITGYGPGPDLGAIYNVTTNPDVPLRNPHNSHVGIVARMGWVGFGMWIIMWGVWALLLLDLRSRLAQRGRFPEAGLVAVPVIGAAMILVNAFFDPSIEGPQVGFPLWFLFGLGAVLQLVYHGFPQLAAAPHDGARGEAPVQGPEVTAG